MLRHVHEIIPLPSIGRKVVQFLAPVTVPAVAEARYLRAQHSDGLKIAYAGTCPPVNSPDLDAAITFGDLELLSPWLDTDERRLVLERLRAIRPS